MTYVIYILCVTLCTNCFKIGKSTTRAHHNLLWRRQLHKILRFSFDAKAVGLVQGEGGRTEFVQDAYFTLWFLSRTDSPTVKY